MKAVINQGTDDEFSWTTDDAISPELINDIERVGEKQQVDWFDSPFFDAVQLFNEKYSLNEIEDMLYDEDPELIEIGLLAMEPFDGHLDHKKSILRLYFPVMLVIVRKMRIYYAESANPE